MGGVDRKNSYDLYWRLNEDYGSLTDMRAKVRDQGYQLDTKKLEKTKLVKLLQRRDRGLLCYDKCSNVELEVFAKARNITCYIDANKSEEMSRLLRDLTLQTLIESDDDQRFERFLDLPPELRNQIYEFYDSHFAEHLYFPTKPPLARVCRITRQEMLPVFFANHQMTIEFIRPPIGYPTFRASDQTYIWLSQLSVADVASINNLRIDVGYKSHKGPGQISIERLGTIQVCLNENGGDGWIEVTQASADHF